MSRSKPLYPSRESVTGLHSVARASSPPSGSTTEPDSEYEYFPGNQLEYFFEHCGCTQEDGHNPTCVFAMPIRDWTDIELLMLARAFEDVDPDGNGGGDAGWDQVAKKFIFEDGSHGGPVVMRNKMQELIHAIEVSD